MTGTPWVDGLLTAIPLAGTAWVLQATQSWVAVLETIRVLQGSGLHPELRWWWLAWILTLAALCVRAGRRR